jgi:hypothetical protein
VRPVIATPHAAELNADSGETGFRNDAADSTRQYVTFSVDDTALK